MGYSQYQLVSQISEPSTVSLLFFWEVYFQVRTASFREGNSKKNMHVYTGCMRTPCLLSNEHFRSSRKVSDLCWFFVGWRSFGVIFVKLWRGMSL